ncbi:MAG: putative baseplate assembly protein [Chloroflexi bacterium]|nr:putative baseplate assembly protein [Chloroflexota bacterium]MCI0576996.1 putative baseplate assembly protein [Chloroflexota bacterium]MCI0647783.1 putative baseplate assembly protein [Chloroflexota bacterium]MCI0729015.1 putative baseplate assembly protein [Chloroflexota bacterium]
MPLELPVLDDRNFEQLLEEAKRRIPAHTPEWTNYNVESDPGITIVQLFTFLTDSLLYRANRIPERNRLKFLQLLGIPLQPPAAAGGLITIRNERGPIEALPLEPGVIVAAGNTHFLTRDNVTVLPVEAQVYYKRPIQETDPRYEEYRLRYEALRAATMVAGEATGGGTEVSLTFYETLPMTLPTAGNPNPVLDLTSETATIDQAIYLALLAPKNVDPEDVRAVIANKTLSIGVVPALSGDIPPLLPLRRAAQREPLPELVYEIPDVGTETDVGPGDNARYARLTIRQQPDVLSQEGIVQVALPEASKLQTWTFPEPLQEGTADFPPGIEDEQVRDRLVTWIRLRLPAQGGGQGSINARLSWVGISATRVIQAVPVVNELLGAGNGEPDQVVAVANTPVIAESIRLEIEDENGVWQLWRLTDDLLSAGLDEPVFTLDPESGQIRFGTGVDGGRRPEQGRRIRASYEYGGGPQGNVAIGAINKSFDVRLQGGYKVSNPLPAAGGDEGETVAEGERRIPLYLRHRDRLVTLRDFADVTRRTPGVDVGRVEVLPLFYPPDTQITAPGVVTLLAIPKNDAVRPRWPSPDRLFLHKVCDHLEPRRLVTTEIYVRGPVYVPVYLSVGIQVREGHYWDQVQPAVRERLEEYLSALPPGGPDGAGWPLNRRLLKKDLEAVVTRVTGVEYVESMVMGVEANLDKEEHDLSGLQLPWLASLTLREGAAEPLSSVLGGGEGAAPTTVRTVPVPVARTTC